MKKKSLLVLCLALVFCFSLSACGGGSSSGATVTTNDGQTLEMTANDLIEEFDANEANFNNLYLGAEIEFTGTVQSVEVETAVIVESGSVKSSQNKIVFEEGWCVSVSPSNTDVDIASLMPGDVVTVHTCIVGSPYHTDFLKEVSNNNRVVWLAGDDFYGYSIKTTITKTAE